MRRRWLYVLLFASLALNLFVLGALAGVWMSRGESAPHEGPPRARSSITAAVRALPPEQQAAWRQGDAAFLEANRTRLREGRRQTREALRALGDDPLNPEAALAALSTARAGELSARAAMDQRLVDFAASLPPAERRAFAEALARPPGRPLGRRGGHALPDR